MRGRVPKQNVEAAEMIEGEINVGDLLDWCPEDHGAWVQGRPRILVLRKVFNPESQNMLVESLELRSGHVLWNQEPYLKKICRRAVV
jgi:hypothetical protein